MLHNVEFLRADVSDELDKLARLAKEFSLVEDKLAEDELSNYDRGAIGYLLHNFYNGCENIFRSIARFFENDLGDDSWHRDLLKRMTLEVPGFRPRVIDETLYRLLDDFRAFRHKFRHSYSFELDWERERLVARRFRTAEGLLRRQLAGFLAKLGELEG